MRNPILTGFGAGMTVAVILAIANGLSTYLLDGQTIASKVASRIGADA